MQKKILDTNIKVENNSTYGTKAGKDTVDKIFMLNGSQAEQYEEILSNYLRDWWLIGPGNSENTAQYVSYGKSDGLWIHCYRHKYPYPPCIVGIN